MTGVRAHELSYACFKLRQALIKAKKAHAEKAKRAGVEKEIKAGATSNQEKDAPGFELVNVWIVGMALVLVLILLQVTVDTDSLI